MRKAFTLIELLMIILIVAILVAIVLPQYQTAVDQGRWSSLVISSRSLADAQNIYFMSTGSYSDSASQLPIEIPGTISDNQIITQEGVYTLQNDYLQNKIEGQHNKLPNNLLVLYLPASSEFAGNLHCEATTANTRANSLCITLGGVIIGEHNGKTVYLLEGTSTGSFD